jgi:hypothetical protein
MNTNTHPDQVAVMTFDGISLMLKRACANLTEVTRVHYNLMEAAAEEDYEKMFTEPAVAARTMQQIDELAASLVAAKEELANIEAYWNSVPWVARFTHPDPRQNRKEDVLRETSQPAVPPQSASVGNSVADNIPSGNSVIGSPKPEFDPALLVNKGVTNIEFIADIRTKETSGKPDIEFVTGGPPVAWLTAHDGTKVVVNQKDFVRLGSIFMNCAPSDA